MFAKITRQDALAVCFLFKSVKVFLENEPPHLHFTLKMSTAIYLFFNLRANQRKVKFKDGLNYDEKLNQYRTRIIHYKAMVSQRFLDCGGTLYKGHSVIKKIIVTGHSFRR